MKKISDVLSGIPMTVVSGVFLASSLIFMLTGIKVPIDPAWVTVFISGVPLVYLALSRLFLQKWISSALLISIAMASSILIGELFAAGEVAFIMAIGAILEDLTVARTKKGISKLLSLVPHKGRRIITTAGRIEEETVRVEQIVAGDILRVLPGETIPADGEIILGSTSVDQSIITGESLPIDKSVGDSVFCGTINRFGSIDMKATSEGENSSLQKLIRMVKEAENNKAPMQRIVDKWAAWLVPIALLIAVITYFITADIIRAVTVLVVFCPCALALATPTSIMAAIGQATKHGVLIKSGEALEKMGKVDCIAFDKTGTLTLGNLEVSDVVPLSAGITEKDVLRLAASAELRSEHPLGKAIVTHAKEAGIEAADAEGFRMVPGRGVHATVDGFRILCGNSGYLKENGVITDSHTNSALEALRVQGKASILVAKGDRCIGIIGLSDVLRPTSKDTVKHLMQMDTDVVLLTGDHHQTAEYFAGQVGICKIRAELKPAEKVSSIQELQTAGKRVCMIGDGVNDAPALKTANVGVAMGSMGSDIAIEAADIALMGDDITKIIYLKRLSSSTIYTIKGNITASMVINFIAITLSVLGLLNPVTGALVHNVGSVLVVLNAALLYDRKFIK